MGQGFFTNLDCPDKIHFNYGLEKIAWKAWWFAIKPPWKIQNQIFPTTHPIF